MDKGNQEGDMPVQSQIPKRAKIDKCFFGQKTALKIQYNQENKSIYLGIGKKEEDDTWTWKTAKMKDTEIAEILRLLQQKTESVNFYHTFDG